MKYERKAGGSEVSLNFKFINGGKCPGYIVKGTFKTKRAKTKVSFIWDPQTEMVVDLIMKDLGEGGKRVSEYRKSVFIDNILAHKEHLSEFLADEYGKGLVEEFEEEEFEKVEKVEEVLTPKITIVKEVIVTWTMQVGQLEYRRINYKGSPMTTWYIFKNGEFVIVPEIKEHLQLLEELYKLNGGV
jgi:hypothetical protein